MPAEEPRLLTWGPPLVGVAGTIAAMLIAFARESGPNRNRRRCLSHLASALP